MVAFRVVVCLTVLAAAAATDVRPCPGTDVGNENLSENVQLPPCKKAPCILRKGTNQSITIKFTPDKDTTDVKNHVTANIAGIVLPFVGVDGSSACDKIFLENGVKAACPLKAGTTYIYQDSFPILDFYPTIPLTVHWGLKNVDNKNVACFEVPASIKNKSKHH